jgi:hypothetical protein
MLDSPAVKARKKITRQRCEQIRNSKPDIMILWATAFPPSIWDSNVLPKSIFDFVLEFLEPEKSQLWPTEIYNTLSMLKAEPPLQSSQEFEAFFNGKYSFCIRLQDLISTSVE